VTDAERARKFAGECTGVGKGFSCSWCPNCKRYDALREAFLAVRADGFSQGVATEREACAKVADDADVDGAWAIADKIRARGQS